MATTPINNTCPGPPKLSLAPSCLRLWTDNLVLFPSFQELCIVSSASARSRFLSVEHQHPASVLQV